MEGRLQVCRLRPAANSTFASNSRSQASRSKFSSRRGQGDSTASRQRCRRAWSTSAGGFARRNAATSRLSLLILGCRLSGSVSKVHASKMLRRALPSASRNPSATADRESRRRTSRAHAAVPGGTPRPSPPARSAPPRRPRRRPLARASGARAIRDRGEHRATRPGRRCAGEELEIVRVVARRLGNGDRLDEAALADDEIQHRLRLERAEARTFVSRTTLIRAVARPGWPCGPPRGSRSAPSRRVLWWQELTWRVPPRV